LDARELLREGAYVDALSQLKKEVRSAPRDAKLRTFLFQFFCIFGEWDRALTQLAVAAELDAATIPMSQAYRAAIRCEMLRERIFAGTRTPTIFGSPEDWMPLLIEANRLLVLGKPDEALGLRDAAFEAAPTIGGSIGDETFDWIADADPRLGPMLEAIVEGKYYWVPYTRLSRIDIEAPADLRDYVWMPVHFTWTTGGESEGFIPSRYPASAHADPALAMARRTEWVENGAYFTGLGQRMLTTDVGDYALLDIRSLVFDAPK